MPRLHAVILAGGAGERFWPASRRARPKPFLQVVGGKTLLEATLQRARRAAHRDCVWIVCGNEHAAAIRKESGLPAKRVLVEPSRRNTAAAIGLVASHIAAHDPDAVLCVLPADHVIPDVTAFASDIKRCARAAHASGSLITLGIKPTRAETGLGYIHRGAAVGREHPGLHRVKRFVEKPNAARARRFLRGGQHLWNAGIFVWSARAILEEIALHEPALHRALSPVRDSGRRLTRAAMERAYRRAPSLPIDIAVMEKSRRVWTLPVRWHWNDVGTWESLAGELGVAPGRSKLVAGALVHDDRGGNLVWGRPERPVALLGVEGLAVVDTGDALLVTRLDRSNDVRGIVKALKAKRRLDVT